MTADLTTAVEAARADLAATTHAIRELWDHLYAPDKRAESGRTSRQSHSRPAWQGAATIQQTYLDVVAELSRAHWELGRHTDVPVHWTHRPDTSERATTVPHSEVLAWTRVLDGMLAWVAAQTLTTSRVSLDEGSQVGEPTPRALEAVETACAHVHAARGRAEDLWPPHRERPPDPVPVCKHCGDREAEKQRKWCSACKRAHTSDRASCGVCGLGRQQAS